MDSDVPADSLANNSAEESPKEPSRASSRAASFVSRQNTGSSLEFETAHDAVRATSRDTCEAAADWPSDEPVGKGEKVIPAPPEGAATERTEDTRAKKEELYPAFKYFKSELLGDEEGAAEALSHVDIVTQQLGPELCGTLLVPFLADAQRNVPVKLRRTILKVWSTLSKISNEESYVHAIIQGVAYLISQEDAAVRCGAVDLVVEIVRDVLSSDAAYDVVGTVVMPLLKRLSESEWFAEAVSACRLIPLVYCDASEQDQAELRQCYKQLWESSLMIVRLEVARNLEKLLPIMHMDDSVSMFWLVLKNMSVDHQEDVRAHCVETCLAFARRCTKEQNLSFSYPVIISASSDASWRVRMALAERYQKIYETFGEEELCTHMLDTHFALLSDAVDIVQETALKAFAQWCHALSAPTAERYIAFFESQLIDSTINVRQGICNIFVAFAARMSKERLREVMVPIVKRLLCDDCMDVRLCVIEHIEVLCGKEDFEGDFAAALTDTVERVLQTTQWRHRLVLAEKITSFYNHFGLAIFEQHFSYMLFKLLMDNVWKVRTAVLASLEAVCEDRQGSWVVDNILTELIKIYVDPRSSQYIGPDDVPLSYAFKIVVIQALVVSRDQVARRADRPGTRDSDSAERHQGTPLVACAFGLNWLQDSTANVRFVAAKALRSVFLIYKDDAPEHFLRAHSVLVKLQQDSDVDVRYYAKMALDTYDDCFPTDRRCLHPPVSADLRPRTAASKGLPILRPSAASNHGDQTAEDATPGRTLSHMRRRWVPSEPRVTSLAGPKGARQASSLAATGAGSTQKAPAGGSSGARQMSSGMVFNKKFGQHMLKNPGILDKIVLAAEIRGSDTVLEIGPGTGNLTVRLVPLARKVIAVDIDNRMVSEVKKRCISMGYNNLEVVEGDALRITLPKFDVCTANLPYQISSPFVFKLLSHRPLFRCAVLMFQKEFAERLLASTNEDKYGRLAINTRLFCTVTRVCKVAPGSFNPPPKVDSMIVKIVPREQPLVVRPWCGGPTPAGGLRRVGRDDPRLLLAQEAHSAQPVQEAVGALHSRGQLQELVHHQPAGPGAGALQGTLGRLLSDSAQDYCMGVLEASGLSNRRSITVSIAEFLELMLKFNTAGIHFANVARPAGAAPDGSSLTKGTYGHVGFEPLAGEIRVPEFLFDDDHMELDDDVDMDD
ncbi:dimethyladenosine transferase [Babesia caballi]|uniref:rRNA adenine N(6)-methyltransferase n=1 Tax=Babesia caballi TaxID=5871 RepID=A0AAV4M1M1_BABCB|nr:dimethyladenosine transferase [Babesia caballi]